MIISQDECVELLLKYKNVSCILEISRAEYQLRNRRYKCGQPLVKFFNENFLTGSGKTLLGAGTPYSKSFDKVLQRLIESGISDKWMDLYTSKKRVFLDVGNSRRAFLL